MFPEDMEFPWDLLESTLERASDVLGDVVSNGGMVDQVCVSDCEIRMEVINQNILSSDAVRSEDPSYILNDEQNRLHYQEISKTTDDIVPESRARSNTWPRLNLSLGSVKYLEDMKFLI